MRIFLFIIASLLTVQAAAEVHWLPASENDLVPPALIDASRAAVPEGLNHSREAVSFAWPLEFAGQSAVLDSPDGFTSSSREFWLDFTAGELARGVELPLSAPGALVRVSVLEQTPTPALSRENLRLHMNGRALDTAEVVEFSVTGADLQQARMAVPDNTLGFELSRDAGAGHLQLALVSELPDATPVVVHVFEPESQIVAHLTTPRLHYLAGETLELSLAVDGVSLQPDSVTAVLTSPDLSASIPISLSRDGTALSARLPAERIGRPGELWEARVYAQTEVDGLIIRRDITVAFNIALPLAQLTGEAIRSPAGTPAIEVGVQAAQAGRYQLSGVLYGTDRAGRLQPVAMAQSATWLEPGRHFMALDFQDTGLENAGLSAPWEIRDLRLTDQGRMGLMQRVEGVRLEQ